MSGRDAPNPEVRRLARHVVVVLERELAGSLLSSHDQAALLLAAAHGRASDLSRAKLREIAEVVWNGCDEGKRRESRTVDFDVSKVDPKALGRR